MTARNKSNRKQSSESGAVVISAVKVKLMYSLCLLVFIAVIIFLFRWQVIDHQKYQELASSRFARQEVKALRGDILARDGSVLSYSEPRYDIFLYKNDTHGLLAAENAGRQTRSELIAGVTEILEMEVEELEEKLDTNSQWIKIADKVDRRTKDELVSIPTELNENIHLDGILYEETSVRVYPEERLGSHLVGFLARDDYGNEIGAAGIEQFFDGVLRPQSGISNLETDSNQNIIALSANEIREARRGAAVKTTIDKQLQSIVEEKLGSAVEKFAAQSGSVIIMDPRTGEILAMANFPDFDPKEYYKVDDPRVLGNTAITTPYEIGSVGKIFTLSAGVDRGYVDIDGTVIDGHEGCTEIIEQRVICTYDKQPRGPLSAADAMIQSDNLALFEIASKLGGETLSVYLEKYGMGQPTSVQLSGEDSGYIKSGSTWNEADLATYSFGHSYTQTALQSIVGVSALANRGNIMEPMIVSELIEQDGRSRVYRPQIMRNVLTEEGVEMTNEILYQVYRYSIVEPQYHHLQKYRLAVKSGTADIPYSGLANPIDKAGYSKEVNTTYVGYDASDKNTFVMLVNISEPQTNPKLSYFNARLLWFELFDEIKDIIGVPAVY